MTSYRDFSLGDKDGKGVALDVFQRIILTRQFAESTHQVVCAEPSPDALQVFSTALAAEVTAKGVTGGISGASSGAAQAISERSQTLMLLRDAMYRICEGYFNSAFDTAEYRYQHLRYRDSMLALLAIEELAGNKRTPGTVVIPNATSVDVDLEIATDDEDNADESNEDEADGDEKTPNGEAGDAPDGNAPAPADKKAALESGSVNSYALYDGGPTSTYAAGAVVPAVVEVLTPGQTPEKPKTPSKPKTPAKPAPQTGTSNGKPKPPAAAKQTPAAGGNQTQDSGGAGDDADKPKKPKSDEKAAADAKKSISGAAVEIVRMTLMQNYDKQYCASYLAEEAAERDLTCDIGARMVVRYCAEVLGISTRSSSELAALASYPKYGCSSTASSVRDAVHLEAMARRKQCQEMGLDNESCTLAIRDAQEILFFSHRDASEAAPDESNKQQAPTRPQHPPETIPSESNAPVSPWSEEEVPGEQANALPQRGHVDGRLAMPLIVSERTADALTTVGNPS